MAWVNRTSRDQGSFQTSASSAAAHLGPGSYETSMQRKIKPNAIGFGCSEKVDRGAAGATKGYPLVTPGPGAYSTSNQVTWESPSKSKATASSTFQSKSQRLVGGEPRRASNKGVPNTPGPGAYAQPDSFGASKKKAYVQCCACDQRRVALCVCVKSALRELTTSVLGMHDAVSGVSSKSHRKATNSSGLDCPQRRRSQRSPRALGTSKVRMGSSFGISQRQSGTLVAATTPLVQASTTLCADSRASTRAARQTSRRARCETDRLTRCNGLE